MPPQLASEGIPNASERLLWLRKMLGQVPPPLLALSTFALGSATTLAATLLYTRYGKRLRNSDWITPEVLGKKRWIKGTVTA